MRTVPTTDPWWNFPFETEVETSMGTLYVEGRLHGGCRVDALRFSDAQIHDEYADEPYRQPAWRPLTFEERTWFDERNIQREIYNHIEAKVQTWAANGGK